MWKMRKLIRVPRKVFGDVEIEVWEDPSILFIYRPHGMVALPHDVYRHFKSLKEVVEWTGRYLDEV